MPWPKMNISIESAPTQVCPAAGQNRYLVSTLDNTHGPDLKKCLINNKSHLYSQPLSLHVYTLQNFFVFLAFNQLYFYRSTHK